MQLFSLGQGTVSPWNIVPRCPRVLLVLPTMSDSSQVSQLSQSQLSDIVGSTSNTLGQRGTMFHGDTVPCPKEKSCIIWTDLNSPCHLQSKRAARPSVQALANLGAVVLPPTPASAPTEGQDINARMFPRDLV